jgi:outer membrane receptor protein involved in Fe transport
MATTTSATVATTPIASNIVLPGLGLLPKGAPIRLAQLGGQEHRAVLERSIAAFGDGTWKMSDRLRVVGGLRLSREVMAWRI